MPKYHFSYSGGGPMPESDEERAAAMQAWEDWFTDLGAAVVDGGHPFGPTKTITAGGAVSDGGDVGGYSVITADDLSAAINKAKGCPVLAGGGNVEVGECIEM